MGFARMRARQIAIRSLTYYWRTNVAVVLGVATAVSVLAGALLVGDSVRGSLRDLLLGRLGPNGPRRSRRRACSANSWRRISPRSRNSRPRSRR